MRMVADSNFLRSEELRTYLSKSRFNKVLPKNEDGDAT
jgi:hypothetical protein